jgi:hypothetical protein
MSNGTRSCLMKKTRVKKISQHCPFKLDHLTLPPSYYRSLPVQLRKLKICGISLCQKSRNSAEFDEFCNMEFRIIPRNFGQFRIVYGIYGIEKNIRNSVSAEFRKHPISVIRYRRQIYRTEKRHSDIGSVPISTSEFIPISDIEVKKTILPCGFELGLYIYFA